ncbi:MAG: amino acid ABC transporter permease [Clostridia bacterium]|jgi:polar amino acid transport system permease protein|nr:amino acid ABC transporter permease [Clostridia bacterium]
MPIDLKDSWEIFHNEFVVNRGYTRVLSGLQSTLIIAVLGLIIGIVLGTALAVTKVIPQKSKSAKVFSHLTDIYVGLFRGTPMVVQLLVMYYVLFPLIGLSKIPALIVAIMAFGMNSGAYVCEIMRSGILSVDKGQMEAGRALGMSYGRTMLKVVIPQAVKNILPTLGNEFISLVKETSVVSFITVIDLTKSFQQIGSATYEYFIPYIVLALCYLVIVYIITLIVKLIERRMRASDRR